MDRRAAKLMAEVALEGDWSIAEVAARIVNSLGKASRRSKWPQKLAERIFENVHFCRKAPTVPSLARFLLNDSRVQKISRRANVAIVRWVASRNAGNRPAQKMNTGLPVAASWNVPAIVTPGQLAEQLELPVNHLDWLADLRATEHTVEKEKLRNYRYHWIRKASGGLRLLEAPKQRLKKTQRWIAENILTRIPPHEAAHAFRTERSPITAAATHVNQHVVMRIDLCDFFPSIKAPRIAGVFRTAGYPPKVVRLLTGLCTNTAWRGILDEVTAEPNDIKGPWDHRFAPLFQPHLPQGSPASPALANLCAWSLDCRLAGLAKKLKVNYTRYADDLVFSGNWTFGTKLRRFRILVTAICMNEGFEIRKRKTTIMREHQQQRVTGIVVNEKPTIARRDIDQLKAILHNCIRTGPDAQNRDQHLDFRSHLAGRIAWVTAVDPRKGQRLKQAFDAIQW